LKITEGKKKQLHRLAVAKDKTYVDIFDEAIDLLEHLERGDLTYERRQEEPVDVQRSPTPSPPLRHKQSGPRD